MMTNRKIPEIEGKPLRYNLGTMAAYSHFINELLTPMMENMEQIATSAFKHKSILSQAELLIHLKGELNQEEEEQTELFELASKSL